MGLTHNLIEWRTPPIGKSIRIYKVYRLFGNRERERDRENFDWLEHPLHFNIIHNTYFACPIINALMHKTYLVAWNLQYTSTSTIYRRKIRVWKSQAKILWALAALSHCVKATLFFLAGWGWCFYEIFSQFSLCTCVRVRQLTATLLIDNGIKTHLQPCLQYFILFHA